MSNLSIQVTDVGFGYSPFPHELSRDPSISLAAKGLFAVYGSFVSVTDPTAYPSARFICKLCGVNEKTFWKYKRELLRAGWISEQQQHKENGQYSTMLVTRYFHPSMNPCKPAEVAERNQEPKNPIKSTVLQKTERRKLERQKTEVKQEPEKTEQKTHTQTIEAVCVPDVEKRPVSPPDLTITQRECIEWTIRQHKSKGVLKNEIGLRCHLVKAALAGELITDEYERHQAAKLKNARLVAEASDAIHAIDEYKREAEEQPLTKEFLEELKKANPHLFISGSKSTRRTVDRCSLARPS